MPQKSRVLRSIEMPDGGRCVDLFVRPNGSYGFEEYRRDSEDGLGWFAIGFHAGRCYVTEDAALADAVARVSWLGDVLQ